MSAETESIPKTTDWSFEPNKLWHICGIFTANILSIYFPSPCFFLKKSVFHTF